MFNSLGRLIARHRVTVLAVMVVVMALLGLAGNMLGKPFGQGGFEDPKSGWATAEMLEQEAYGRDSVGDVVVTYHAPEGTDIDDPAFLSRIQSSLDQIKAEHPGEVTGVTSYSTNHAPASPCCSTHWRNWRWAAASRRSATCVSMLRAR